MVEQKPQQHNIKEVNYSKYFYHVKLTNFIWSVDMTNKSKQKMKKMNFLSQPRVRVRKQTIEKKNENILSVTRGVYDPNIFKVTFLWIRRVSVW